MQRIETFEKREEVENLTEDERGLLLNYRKEIHEFYRMEEIMRCQRVRSKWLKEGDANTSYFPRVANIKHRLKAIHALNTIKGQTVRGEDLKNHIFEHSRQIFGQSESRRITFIKDM